MHADLVNLGWTEEQWNRIGAAVADEAQRARVAAQALPTCGPEDPSIVAVPNYTLTSAADPNVPAATTVLATNRLEVNSAPDLPLTTIAVNVQLKTADVADPELRAALVMFRRAANIVARIEDALVFNGWNPGAAAPPPGLAGVPAVYKVTVSSTVPGLLSTPNPPTAVASPANGQALVSAIVAAITALEGRGQLGPFACMLDDSLFQVACDPTGNLVLPRDRILPFLQGPLLRSSTLNLAKGHAGVVIATAGEPIELVVAADIHVRYVQATAEPRYVFRVSERVALRIKDAAAVQKLS
jgi:uncharacterized linocin/CFP29 family protein